MSDEAMSYVARCPTCNGMVMVTVDKPERKKENAKEIAACVREGFVIERVTNEYVRAEGFFCKCVRGTIGRDGRWLRRLRRR